MDIPLRRFDNKKDTYLYFLDQLNAILSETDDGTAGLANTAALMYLLLPDLNWAGFYLLKNGALVLGPFQGKPAVPHIGIGRGVCGTAAQTGQAQLVRDVHCCDNHIACDLNSRSEIVVPLYVRGSLYGVIDIDSPVTGRFDFEDLTYLTQAAERLQAFLERS